MSNEKPIDEQPPLESAIHHLKEAQNLHDSQEYNRFNEDAAIEK